MTRSCIRCALITLAVAAAFLMNSPQAAHGNPLLEMYFEIPLQGATGLDIPPAETVWSEIIYEFGNSWQQTQYLDHGDGLINLEDEVYLDPGTGPPWWCLVAGAERVYTCWPLGMGEDFPVVLDPSGQSCFFEPQAHDPAGPEGEMWLQVHPYTCDSLIIETWFDNDDSGIVDAGDWLLVGAETWVVQRVGLGVLIWTAGVPTQASTWGQFKRTFAR